MVGTQTVRVVITGASGFIGRALVRSLSAEGHEIVPIVRRPQGFSPEVIVEDIRDLAALDGVLPSTDVLIHLAGRAHVLNDVAADPLAEFREINTSATIKLAARAARAGVRRFIFMSTIGVNGDETQPGRAFHADSPANPATPYALSKWEAEQGLRAALESTGMELVIIRPPLVYGKGAKGRFASLARWIGRGWPLPFGLLQNRRHFVSIENLTHFVGRCVIHPNAAGETFLVADRESVSTREFASLLASRMNARPLLVPIPASLLWMAAKVVRKQTAARSVLASLEIDLEKNLRLLSWTPPVSLPEGLDRTVG